VATDKYAYRPEYEYQVGSSSSKPNETNSRRAPVTNRYGGTSLAFRAPVEHASHFRRAPGRCVVPACRTHPASPSPYPRHERWAVEQNTQQAGIALAAPRAGARQQTPRPGLPFSARHGPDPTHTRHRRPPGTAAAPACAALGPRPASARKRRRRGQFFTCPAAARQRPRAREPLPLFTEANFVRTDSI
jgi:hypothetical protein